MTLKQSLMIIKLELIRSTNRMTIITGGDKRIRKISPPLDQIIHIAHGVNNMKCFTILR